MSNPGSIGTLGMLLETSGKGGNVNIDLVPMPNDQSSTQFLTAYQGCGFVVTCPKERSDEIIDIFGKVKVTAAVVGSVDVTNRLVLESEGKRAVLFDFASDKITGCGPSMVPGYCGIKS